MKNIITYRGKQIEIIQDIDAQSPSEYADTGLFLVANHRQCYIPEPGEKHIPATFKELVDKYKKTHWIFPVEAYIHSGVHLSLSGQGNYPDRRWDVSQLGAVFVAKSEWRLSKKALTAAQALLTEWNQYFSGDVWGYKVGEDSCWGFHGQAYCIEQAKEIADYQIEKERKERIERVKTFIKNRVPLFVREQELSPA